MHSHISLLDFLTTALEIIIFGFFWRFLSIKWSDNALGKAMAFIY